ncbi:Phospholipase C, phosphatidylinositol-specific, Y domain [Dillenia turbinata]|uniref:Phosphoinositide phospholipase C n=1 Tax=Dillenia turbinata TaxID=194707 RepID=A0AAN8ZMR3_9MAGN
MLKQTYKICFCFRRRFKLTVAEPPAEIKSLFDKYSENGIMTADHLNRFLIEVQGERTATKQEAEAIIESLKELKHLNMFHRKTLNLEAFFKYLFSDSNTPLLNKVNQDMTASLSHYFVFTGHNSYLTGNQLSSDCSDVPIIKALQRGVRVIELDLWPNSSKDDIHVIHGRTLTTPVELIKCLKSIKEHAFEASEYPVIITLEDHLTPDLRAKMAKMVTQIYGDVLHAPAGSECSSEFPSPESLKGRIVISTKPPKEYLESKSLQEKDEDSEKGEDSSKKNSWGIEVSDLKSKFENFDKINPEDGDDAEEEDIDDAESKLQQSSATEYGSLIAIHAGKLKGGINEWLKIDPDKVRRISLNEQKLEKAVIIHSTELIRFTQKNLLRVFPRGTRFDSSNYNPLLGWMYGAQMVAFNMQVAYSAFLENVNLWLFLYDVTCKVIHICQTVRGHGRSLWLMQGLFRANGGCGYVKKPDILLKVSPGNEVFDPKAKLPVNKTLKVKVYMGEGWYLDFRHTHFDIYSPPDFYVRVGIAGVPADSLMKKTRSIEDDWTPTWNEEFEFPLTVPELALLRIEVHDYDMSEKDDFGGQTCLPLSELRTGIRTVPLYDQKGDKYNNVKLLMRFEFV